LQYPDGESNGYTGQQVFKLNTKCYAEDMPFTHYTDLTLGSNTNVSCDGRVRLIGRPLYAQIC